MPPIRSMFPKKYLSYEDFKPGEVITATIKTVSLSAARVTRSAQPGQAPQADPEWDLWFYEFPKPIRLRKSRAAIIAAVTGEENTDRWEGKRIGFYRGMVPIAGEMVEGIIFDNRPTPQVTAALAGPSSETALLSPGMAGRLLPAANVARFHQVCKQHGKNWGAFLNWLRFNCREGFDRIKDQDPADGVDGLVAPAMKRYLDEISAGPPQTDVHSARRQVVEEPIREDDIPF